MLVKGIAGALIAAVCCFTPLLVGLFIITGLSGFIGGIDYVVFPVMFASLGVVAMALYQRAGSESTSPKPVIIALVVAFSALLIWLQFRYAVRLSLAAVGLVVLYGLYLRFAPGRRAARIDQGSSSHE
jgi:chromate transport protein ChrA